MAEINNNIPRFVVGKNIEIKETADQIEQPVTAQTEEQVTHTYAQDTGVLGRSQVKCTKCGDITKSVEDAVALAKKNPTLLNSSEGVFNVLYNDFVASGMEESEAYMKALMGEEEFMELGIAYNK